MKEFQNIVFVFISIYFLALHCGFTESQNLRDLSYGSEVYVPPPPPSSGISTSTVQPTSTTKKSGGFLSGIKKIFGRGSTTTSTEASFTPTSTSSTARTSNSPISTPSTPTLQTNRDNVNQNNNNLPKPGFPQQGVPQSGNNNFQSGVITLTTPPNKRDYVNPNPYKPQTPPSSPTIGVPSSQPQANDNSGRRDYVNPNLPSRPQSLPSPSTPATGTSTSQPQINYGNSGQRDYVNPNLPSRPQSLPSSPTSAVGQPQMNYGNSGQRDYVNPNLPSRPQSLPSSPTSAVGQPQMNYGNSDRRDYVNPNLPSRPQSLPSSPIQTPTNPTAFKSEDFPPLPAPGSPASHRGRFTTRQPSVTSSTQSTNNLATDEELETLTETLFSKDTNNQNKNVIANYQGQTRSSETNDMAPEPLLRVQDEVFQSPTITKMRLLYNNYEMDTSVNEHITPIERQEENEFIDAILKTQVMRQTMIFLQNKGLVTPDPRTHKELLKTIWFSMYSRGGGRIGSSAFEHVFLHEIKNGTITGLHNWVYFFEEERQGHLDYKGYIKKLDLGNKGVILKYRFDYNGVKKPVNAMFIGTSPELEIALYTICFQVRPDKSCPIRVNRDTKFNIQTYTFRYRGKNLIGSAFPEI